MICLTWSPSRTLVSYQSLLDAEVVETEGSLVSAQREAFTQVLRASDTDHSVISHLPRLGLGLEECEVVG